MQKDRLHIALLAGGKSAEREVSLNGAATVAEALDKEKFQITRYDPLTDLEKLAIDAPKIDFAIIIMHGVGGEDGSIQGFLELLGIPYQGSGVAGSAFAMDKHVAKVLYESVGLPVAPWEKIEKNTRYNLDNLVRNLGLPVVVKPVAEGSSLGLSIVRDKDELAHVLGRMSASTDLIVEKYIEGREVTASVLGNDDPHPLPVVEIIPGEEFAFFDYEAKYKPGASREICPAEIGESLTEKVQQYGLAAHKVLQLRGYSRTDMIVDEHDTIYLLETNTIPGMTPTSLFPQAAEAVGLSFSKLLEKLIHLGLEDAG